MDDPQVLEAERSEQERSRSSVGGEALCVRESNLTSLDLLHYCQTLLLINIQISNIMMLKLLFIRKTSLPTGSAPNDWQCIEREATEGHGGRRTCICRCSDAASSACCTSERQCRSSARPRGADARSAADGPDHAARNHRRAASDCRRKYVVNLRSSRPTSVDAHANMH